MRVVVVVDEMSTESVTAVLLSEGAAGIETQDGDTFAASEIPAGQARVITFFGGEAPESVNMRLSSALKQAEIEVSLLSAEVFTDESWKHTWKAFFEPAQVSAHLAVAPPWDVPDRGDNVHTVVIEPGLAFGTGTHATTLLCLAWLDDLLAPNRDGNAPHSLIDVGCGSGILSIAAAKLRPTLAIDALDIDPEAQRVSRENFELNGVAAGVRLLESSTLDKVDERYELVVANILSHILVYLSDGLVKVTAVGGALLLSGIGDDSVETVLETFVGKGMKLVEQRRRDGWNALLMERETK